MQALPVVFLSFIRGAVPYSLILGQLVLKKDIRNYGDGNPGAANAWRGGGPVIGVVSVLLEICKAYIPIYYTLLLFDFPNNSLIVVDVAQIVGHAYSTCLHLHGGKAVECCYGIW